MRWAIQRSFDVFRIGLFGLIRAARQAAFEIRDKDLSVDVSVTNSISNYVSVRDQITASQKYKQVYRVAV